MKLDKLAFAGLLAIGLLAVTVSPERVRAQEEPPQLAPCPKSGTYTVDVDGAPNNGACRAPIAQAEAVAFNIPPGDLFDALKAWLEQSGARGMVPLDIMMANLCTGSNCVRGPVPTAGVTGTMPPRAALDQLLARTGVTFVQDQSGTFHFPPLKDTAAPGGRCVWKPSPWKGCG